MITEVMSIDPGQTAGFCLLSKDGKINGFTRKVGQPKANAKQVHAIDSAVQDLLINRSLEGDLSGVVLQTSPFQKITQAFTVRDFMVAGFTYIGEEPQLLHDSRARSGVWPDKYKLSKNEAHLLLAEEFDLSSLDVAWGPYIVALTSDLRKAERMPARDCLDAVIGALWKWKELGVDIQEWRK